MTKRRTTAVIGLGLILASGCPKSGADGSQAPTPAPAPAPATGERPSLTSADCQARGGTIVGDIGDGAIHRPEYRCENGEPPIGTIRPAEGEPVAVEGSVCCPAAATP